MDTFDADQKAIQQINFTGNQDREEDGTIIFIIEEGKENISDFSTRSTVNTIAWRS